MSRVDTFISSSIAGASSRDAGRSIGVAIISPSEFAPDVEV
jgi:hypothetical protein